LNKRQIKKRAKIINERIRFFSNHFIYSGRGNGKTSTFRTISKACFNKKYRPFKALKKIYGKIFVGVDLSNGRDYGVSVTATAKKGVISVIQTCIIDEMHDWKG
jgi:hypothetical protein